METRRQQSFKALFWACSTCFCLLSVSIARGGDAFHADQTDSNSAQPQDIHLYVQVAPEESFGVTSYWSSQASSRKGLSCMRAPRRRVCSCLSGVKHSFRSGVLIVAHHL